MSKRCNKCGIEKDESEFTKPRNRCKQCRNEENRMKYQENEEYRITKRELGRLNYLKNRHAKKDNYNHMKTCSVCNIEKNELEFYKNRRQCKQCLSELKKEHRKNNIRKIRESELNYYRLNSDKRNQNQIIYYYKNKEKILETIHKYHEKNKHIIYEKKRIYRELNGDMLRQRERDFRKDNPDIFKGIYLKNKEKLLLKHKIYTRSQNGKIAIRRKNTKRRKLGYKPINQIFEESNYHHLRYVEEFGEMDNGIGIYIPKELHESIRHNGTTGKNMDLINIEALKWYFNNVDKDKINQNAVSIYNRYIL